MSSSGRRSLQLPPSNNRNPNASSSSSSQSSSAAATLARLSAAIPSDTSASSRVSLLNSRLQRLRNRLTGGGQPPSSASSSSRLSLLNLPSFETLDSFWDLGGNAPVHNSSSSSSGSGSSGSGIGGRNNMSTTSDRRRRRTLDHENSPAGDTTTSSFASSSILRHHNQHHNHGISKRRRVDERPHGQVFREVLPLQLMQCDGGIYRGRDVVASLSGHPSRRRYGPENVLKTDDSVYCSSKSTCNMIFRHESGRCFTIEKLVIKAPGSDYTSPVSEGMVFITMDSVITNLVEKTVRSQSGSQRDKHDDEGDDDDDDYEGRNNDVDDESESDGMAYINIDRSDCPYEPLLDDLSDDDDDDGDGRATRETMSLMSIRAAAAAAGITIDEMNSQRRPAPSREHVTVTAEPSHSADGLIEPHVHFKFLAPVNKSVITFDPPIYCRNILIKMWAQPPSDPDRPNNIDIQTIAAYGYYGRRYFPAMKPM